ncbi:MAG: hypothetical protein V4459_12000 [Pseudomonadota bacterium]
MTDDDPPPRTSAAMRIFLSIVLAPLAFAFLIAASLSGGVSEVFKAITGRK